MAKTSPKTTYNRVRATTRMSVKMPERLRADIEYAAAQITDPQKNAPITPSEFVRRACISYLRRLGNGKSPQQQLF